MPAKPSPFPGMDPWLERHWNDVHPRVIEEVADQIGDALPAGLFVSVERDLYVVDPESPRTRQLYQPDVALGHGGVGASDPPAQNGTAAGVAEPIRLVITDPRVAQGHVEIRDLRDDRRLVTAVEVFSPTNKRGRLARAEYVRKRDAYFRRGANVVELDLLRAGRHLVAVSLDSLGAADVTPYRCCVRRAGVGGLATVEYYPIPLRQRLPRIRVPLRPGDDDAIVDLQQPIDVVYARRRLGEQIDYGRPPIPPPLPLADAAWAAERIAMAAL